MFGVIQSIVLEFNVMHIMIDSRSYPLTHNFDVFG